ncbi:MAG: hypothetical protein WD052_10975 [Bacteroidales bacterium]
MGKWKYIILLMLFHVCTNIYGQKKWTFSAGIGIPEAMNMGIRYNVNNFKFGLNPGIYPGALSGSKYYYYNMGVYSSYHFENSREKKRYVRGGFIFSSMIYYKYYSGYWENKELLIMLDFRIGRQFIFQRGGLDINLGLIFSLLPELYFDLLIFESVALPSFGVSYLFGKLQ